jgi:hypothetical protein
VSDLPEVERRLRATFARRAEDMAAGDHADPHLGLVPTDPVGAAPASAQAFPAGAGPSRPRRNRVALIAAVAAVAVPLVVGAVVLARGGEPTPPAGRPQPPPEVQPEVEPEPSCPGPDTEADPCARTPAPVTTTAPAITTTSTASVPGATGTPDVPGATPATVPPPTTTAPAPPPSDP